MIDDNEKQKALEELRHSIEELLADDSISEEEKMFICDSAYSVLFKLSIGE